MVRRLGSWFLLGILTLVVFLVDSAAEVKPGVNSKSRPNIILVTLDSARADRMGFLGGRGGLTPTLDGIAHQGLVFTQAYAQAPDTVASSATVLSGTYPQTHQGGELGIPLAPSVSYLPDLLHANGYSTAAFVGSILLDPKNGPFQGYDRGFAAFDADFHQPQPGESRFQSVERHSDQVAARATKWLAGKKQSPFFIWIHLPGGTANGSSYDREVTAADAAVGKLVTFLKNQSLYDDALIIIASSHGESLGAHGEDAHGIFLYDETIHVPLLMKLPKNQFAGKQVKNRARLLDIAPTVLAEAGIAVPARMQGQSLLRIAQATSQSDQPAYARSELPRQWFGCSLIESWRAGKYLYIRAPKPELYDVSTDPEEMHNLAPSAKATLETMAAQLQAFDSRLANEPDKATGAGLSSSEMQKLASLGYVGLQKGSPGTSAATEGKDPKDAIADINKTLEALQEIDDGKPEKALPTLRQAVASQSNSYLAQYGVGRALAVERQYAEAVPYLHKAIELQPDAAWAHYEMGLSLMKTGDFKTAAVHLEIASGRLPGFSGLHAMLAEVYEHLGRSAQAADQRTLASPQKKMKNN